MRTADSISSGLLQMGVPITAEQIDLLAEHWEAVVDQNRTLNLTSVRPEDGVRLHILDSCTAADALAAAPPGRFADIGSGAGYPGIVLSVLSGRTVELVESTKKKTTFLQAVIGSLCLNGTVRPIRAEQLACEHPGEYAAVTARAVAPLASLVELAAPLLQPAGLLICLKGAPSSEEAVAGDVAAGMCGMSPGRATPVSVPGLDARRTLVVYARTGDSRVELPRRAGMAQTKPLA